MISAIIVAAGKGARFNESLAKENAPSTPKQFLPLAGMPLYLHGAKRLSEIDEVDALVLVAPPGNADLIESDVKKHNIKKVAAIVPGGEERQDSVWNGLQSVPEKTHIVLVHDGARPFPPTEQTREAVRLAKEEGAAILALASTDTVKVSETSCSTDHFPRVQQTIERARVWRAQTPQVFQLPLLIKAYEYIRDNTIQVTDEAQAVECINHPVIIIPSSETNLKVTTPADLDLAIQILDKNPY